ncbi:hypothetical protein NDU88_005445 [Pleurodeles waltl]|uniref:Uncharacterized protein n=1 Tax=Pleurodeles waltl TaxID=8319 RepID=A0AAV7UIZ9_PLEWA|nr:hypothetical protein NDU88_005445 [Pleurodeles waltl]
MAKATLVTKTPHHLLEANNKLISSPDLDIGQKGLGASLQLINIPSASLLGNALSRLLQEKILGGDGAVTMQAGLVSPDTVSLSKPAKGLREYPLFAKHSKSQILETLAKPLPQATVDQGERNRSSSEVSMISFAMEGTSSDPSSSPIQMHQQSASPPREGVVGKQPVQNPPQVEGAEHATIETPPVALKHTLDAPEVRCRDCGDSRGNRELGQAAWPREEPDSAAPAPRPGEELKRGRSPRAD